jgi:hypothetical protein
MNDFNFDAIAGLLDAPATKTVPRKKVEDALRLAGYGPNLGEWIGGLCEAADGGTFCNHALRLHPFEGDSAHGLPSLIDWNSARGWKKFQPAAPYDRFYFASNSFGDLFAIPLDEKGDIARARTGALWVEKFEYQEAGIPPAAFLQAMQPGNDLAPYFARLPAHQWAAPAHGIPQPWQCFSSKVPDKLGGRFTLDNIAIQSLVAHVGFTLQALTLLAKGDLKPGMPLPKADLYDRVGTPLA